MCSNGGKTPPQGGWGHYLKEVRSKPGPEGLWCQKEELKRKVIAGQGGREQALTLAEGPAQSGVLMFVILNLYSVQGLGS